MIKNIINADYKYEVKENGNLLKTIIEKRCTTVEEYDTKGNLIKSKTSFDLKDGQVITEERDLLKEKENSQTKSEILNKEYTEERIYSSYNQLQLRIIEVEGNNPGEKIQIIITPSGQQRLSYKVLDKDRNILLKNSYRIDKSKACKYDSKGNITNQTRIVENTLTEIEGVNCYDSLGRISHSEILDDNKSKYVNINEIIINKDNEIMCHDEVSMYFKFLDNKDKDVKRKQNLIKDTMEFISSLDSGLYGIMKSYTNIDDKNPLNPLSEIIELAKSKGDETYYNFKDKAKERKERRKNIINSYKNNK